MNTLFYWGVWTMINLSEAWDYWTPDLLHRACLALREPDLNKAIRSLLNDSEIRSHPKYHQLYRYFHRERKEKDMALILEFQRHADLAKRIGKLNNICVRPDGYIYDRETGEIISVVKYPFDKWNAEYFIKKGYEEYFPMKAHPNVAITLDRDNGVVQHKLDGVSSRCWISKKGLRFFGPRIVKNSGWVGEYSDKVIHLRDLRLPPEFRGTVLDGEFVHPSGIMPDRLSAGILSPNTKYETAWYKQAKEGWLVYVAYDILRFKGADVTKLPYSKRLELLDLVMYDKKGLPYHECFFPIYSIPVQGATIDGEEYSQKKYYDYIMEKEMEGVIWCSLDGKYYPGKRSRDKVKFKSSATFDVIITGFEPPTREVDFNVAKTNPEDWPYWVNKKGENIPEDAPFKVKKKGIPVTKFYYYGWIGSIKFGVLDEGGEIIEVGKTSGMDEQVRQVLSSKKDKKTKKFRGNRKAIGSVIEVEGQRYDNGPTIRWPRFVRFRPDKPAEQCTLKNHMEVR